MTEEMTIIGEEAYRAAKELLEAAKPEPEDLFVVGCSTSEVAVPVRIRTKEIGDAHAVCARTRAKFIGGSRKAYDEGRM